MQDLRSFLRHRVEDAALSEILAAIADCCVGIAGMIRRAGVSNLLGTLEHINVQGEVQKTLDVRADGAFAAMVQSCAPITCWVSEENPDIQRKPGAAADRSGYAVFYDPLDGSSNIDVNLSIGSIFSVYTDQDDILRPGRQQLAAGYALYGPGLMLVITVGRGTHGFGWDPQTQRFVLTHPDMWIPPETQEYAINAARVRHWSAAVKRYVDECEAGKSGVRKKDFSLRWAASMVADVHRVLCRGGIFLYPVDADNANEGGKLRLMYEANPMAMLVTQAGGLAWDGERDILAITPGDHHQRVGVILGSKAEVERLTRYSLVPSGGNVRGTICS